MSDDHQGSGDPGRRRPPPPTIDLTATEVQGTSGSEDAANAPSAGDDQDAPASAAAETNATPRDAAAPEAADADPVAPAEPPPDDLSPRAPPPDGRGFFASAAYGIPWSAIGGGIGGALIVLLLAAGLRTLFVDRDKEVDEHFARLDAQVRDLSARPAPQAAAPQALDELAARVARLEQAPAAPRRGDPAVDNRLSALEASTRSLADALANLNRRADEGAAALRDMRGDIDAVTRQAADAGRQAAASPGVATNRADIDRLGQRLDALESATASLKEAVGRIGEPERTTRLAVLAIALDGAVARGTPYAAELAAARAAAADPKALDPLQPFAQSGVPSPAALARELAALAPKMPAPAAAPPPAGGFLDRLKSNAEGLVRFRSIDATQGDDPAAIVARMQAKVAQGDVAGALADAARLPADARATLDAWSKKAAARQAAVAAAQRLAADSLAALGRGSSQGGQPK